MDNDYSFVDAAERSATKRRRKRILLTVCGCLVFLAIFSAILLSGPRSYTAGPTVSITRDEAIKKCPGILLDEGQIALMSEISTIPELLGDSEVSGSEKNSLSEEQLGELLTEYGVNIAPKKAFCYSVPSRGEFAFGYSDTFYSYMAVWNAENDLSDNEFTVNASNRFDLFKQKRYINLGNEEFYENISDLNVWSWFDAKYLFWQKRGQ
ncbi:MAG: hypothetical protein PUB32_05990 [Clostridiales bacterium]|nr:hypothetical protein [Clostridiales bacterium]